MIDYTKLKELAEAATPGPWRDQGMQVNSGNYVIVDTELDYERMAENSSYIAAVSPDVVLAMVVELERLTECLTKANKQAEYFKRMQYLLIDAHEDVLTDNLGVIDAAKNENAQLREAIGTAYGHLWHVNNEPGTPAPYYSDQTASYAARKALMSVMTHEERGTAINTVRAAMKESKQ